MREGGSEFLLLLIFLREYIKKEEDVFEFPVYYSKKKKKKKKNRKGKSKVSISKNVFMAKLFVPFIFR